MSRIGKKPVNISDKVKVTQKGKNIEVTGPKGTLNLDIIDGIQVDINGNELNVTRKDDSKRNRALHGLYRSLVSNMVTGVDEGFKKKLELVGIGYRAELKGNNLVLMLGFSHPTVFCPPDNITIEVPNPNTVVINGISKDLVGLVASKIRSFRLPEPYKGKGIKYENEVVRRKAGKAAAK
ncbi:MAG TPA: 50S ribosomal protein L6 [Ignavibacteria bacterium]|nr:50S ribosomal protein L6 [Ignavibacteria bacterium]HMR40381.1 50S ribosomal protein L6 [Ignavibacteria bacterium]